MSCMARTHTIGMWRRCQNSWLGGAECKRKEENFRPVGGGKDAYTDDNRAGFKTLAGPQGVMATSRPGAGLALVDEIKEGSLIMDNI